MIISQAIIMAGGEGCRMQPVSNFLPKCYLPIYDEPLLVKQLKWLAEAGVEEVIIATDKKFGDFVTELLPYTGMEKTIKIQIVIEKKVQGIGLALLDLKEQIAENPFIFLLGDEYFDHPSFFREIKELEGDGIVMGTVSYQEKEKIQKGCNFLMEDDCIKKLFEKPKEEEIVSEWCWSGVSVFDKRIFEALSEDKEMLADNRVLIHTLNGMIENGVRIRYLKDRSENINMTVLEDYYQACTLERKKYLERMDV